MNEVITIVDEMKQYNYMFSLQYFNKRLDGPWGWVAAFVCRDRRIDAIEYVGYGDTAVEATLDARKKFNK